MFRKPVMPFPWHETLRNGAKEMTLPILIDDAHSTVDGSSFHGLTGDVPWMRFCSDSGLSPSRDSAKTFGDENFGRW
jgi:hypothetical protein